MAKPKKILIGSYHLWDWCFKGGMHFLTEYFLEKEWKVIFVTMPFSIFTIANHFNTFRSERVPKLFKLWKGNGEILKKGQLKCYAPFTLFHPTADLPRYFDFFQSDFVVKNFLNTSFSSIAKWLCRHDFLKPDILMVESGISLSLSTVVKAKDVIYRISDDPSDMNKARGIVNLERKILKEANIILPVSKAIEKRAILERDSSQGIYYLPNGVEIKSFLEEKNLPEEYKKLKKPIAVYVGGLSQEMIDYRLIKYFASGMPDISFVFIGPFSNVNLESFPKNVHFLGPKPYIEIPDFLQHADIGLMPFAKTKIWDKAEKPLKFYQYMASGLPIVSVACGNLDKMGDDIFFAETPEDFLENIKAALKTDGKYKRNLQNIAKKHSWDIVYEVFEEILTGNGIDL